MNARPRMSCILAHCGLQSEILSNETEGGGEEKGGGGRGGSGGKANNKRKQNPRQSGIGLEIRRQRQEDQCKFKAPLIYVESLKIKAK